MHVATAIAFIGFAVALSIESFIQARFWRLMQDLHPTQLAHFNLSSGAHPLARRNARATMLYLRDKSFRLSFDRGGTGHCDDDRRSMIFSYWATTATGCVLVLAVFLHGRL
ncbi:hypothetical protein [Lysobacter enzymogenes]|uniref:Uncharacterized protein n=1 Tax=Lysobacter enzymogenes TaxID=69 RepID=A0AAU9ADH2_LYSEN|nr:hypothetical protein [Lysobacter enzymogenes]BAV97080.1 hypothetical protein LEN_1593 [Lysobacter enzymogenes]